MCENPFVRLPTGVKKKGHIIHMSEEARMASTPFPCGHCLPCRINKSRVWTHRLLLEQTQHSDSSFITLTYNDENLPKDKNLYPNDMQKFIKRLRRRTPQKIRYFGVGEYGLEKERPHYHLALFGLGPLHSNVIRDAWNSGRDLVTGTRGRTQTLELNKDLARYITGYITNYMTHKNDHRLKGRTPEFMRCSKNGGGLGLGAIKNIAKKLLKEPAYKKNRIIRELGYGNKMNPLGRYLTDKLSMELNLSGDLQDAELYLYQKDIFVKHIESDDYVSSIINEKAQHRKKQSKRHQIYSRNKTI